MASLQTWSAFFCRLVMAAFYVPSGLKYLKDFDLWTRHYEALHAMRGLPWPRGFLIAGIATEVGCGLALLVGVMVTQRPSCLLGVSGSSEVKSGMSFRL